MDFNNREIAIGVWLALVLLVMLHQKAIRLSLLRLLRTVLQVKIVVPLLSLLVYVSIIIALLSMIGLWSKVLLKDTVYWFVGVGLVLFGKSVEYKNFMREWNKLVKEQIGILVVLTFIMNSYTFSLPVELLLVPLAVAIVMITTVADMNKGFADIARLFGIIQAVLGWLVLIAAFAKAINDYTAFATLKSIQRFFLPFALTVFAIPFMYALALYARYDYVLVWSAYNHPRKLTRYIRLKALRYGGLNLTKANHLSNISPHEFMQVRSPKEFDALITQLKKKSED